MAQYTIKPCQGFFDRVGSAQSRDALNLDHAVNLQPDNLR
jgi:hypothetical protein